MNIGDRVVFRSHVYRPPYVPHYDKYAGHTFRVVKYLVDEGEVVRDHLWLECITSPKVAVEGYVHDYDLKVKDC